MNNTAKVLRWGYTEIVRVACSNKKANKAADRFIDATIKFCKALRKSADWFGFGIAVVNEDGTIADNKQKEKILDEYIRYTHTKKKNEKITIWMSETNLADAIDSQSFENGICISMLDNGKPEVSLNPIYDYFKSLGILDKVQDMNCSVSYRNAVDIAHFILSDKLNSVINLRNAMSDDHDRDGEICATINLNNRGKSVSDFVMTEDMSILEKNPEKKWFLNVSGVLIGMAFKQDVIKATQQEYKEAVKEYFGEQMLTVFEQHPEGLSILCDCNGLCVGCRELIKNVEAIRDSIKFNMLMMKTDNWQELGADYMPYAELEDDETITYLAEIVAVSEDMEMVRMPLI